MSRDGFVHFGDLVMLVNPGEENVASSLSQVGECLLVLSVVVFLGNRAINSG